MAKPELGSFCRLGLEAAKAIRCRLVGLCGAYTGIRIGILRRPQRTPPEIQERRHAQGIWERHEVRMNSRRSSCGRRGIRLRVPAHLLCRTADSLEGKPQWGNSISRHGQVTRPAFQSHANTIAI